MSIFSSTQHLINQIMSIEEVMDVYVRPQSEDELSIVCFYNSKDQGTRTFNQVVCTSDLDEEDTSGGNEYLECLIKSIAKGIQFYQGS